MHAEVVDDGGDAGQGDAAPVGHQILVPELAVFVVEEGGEVGVEGAGVDADLADPLVGLRDQRRCQPG